MAVAVAEAKPALATDVFQIGELNVKPIKVPTWDASAPPKPLLVFSPMPPTEASYPVLLFLHGFCITNSSYGQILNHISSHGFIVVAPQLYNCTLTSQATEINSAAAVTNWLSTGLQTILPENVQANLQSLALAGHSRGGKAAFALALGYAQTTLKFSILLGLDPVGASSVGCQKDPKILNYIPQSFNNSIPVAVIGTGLGPEHKYKVLPACAPNGVNHDQFFSECKPPCYYFYAKDYGHMEMLDDGSAILSSCMCVSGNGDKDRFRRCLGGVFVAFLRAYLTDESEDLKAIVSKAVVPPVVLDPIIYIEA